MWVVNHISDSGSIVNVGRDEPNRVTRTPLVDDEPRDIAFAGPQKRRAFITTAHRGQNSPVDPQLTTPGVSLSTSGVLNGVPTPAGTYHFTPLATDPSSGCGAVRDYTLTVE